MPLTGRVVSKPARPLNRYPVKPMQRPPTPRVLPAMRQLLPTLALVAGLVLACGSDPAGGSGGGSSRFNKGLPAVGDPLPTFAGVTLDGTALDNDDLEGATTLITVWFYG